MASGAVLGYQTLLQRGDGQPTETFATIAEVLDITGPSSALDTVEVTNMDSADNYKEYIAGLLDGGEITFDVNFTNVTSQVNVITDHQNRTRRNFKMILPISGNPEWTFTGFVTGFDNSQPVQDKITASFTIKITGKPTLT